jgi:phage gp36-like protein
MAYATIADLQARFGQAEVEQLSDREQPGQGWAVDAVAQRALDDAAGLIDARLGARFAVPVASPSTELVRVACDIARYLMHDLAPPEPVRDHYTDAIKWLDKIASGALPLIDSTGAAVSQLSTGAAGGGAVAAYPASATFGESFAEAWAP